MSKVSSDNSTHNQDRLVELLHKYFGYSTFKSLQREIIEENLAGKDVVALLPTGGGKSLCYQLPALMREGLTLVISPLIALMKDQVDSLTEAGIPAAFLNSSLSSEESSERIRQLYQKKYKIIYLAPERLLLDGMIDALIAWGLSAIAIDEAHCISSWGHDFRPEYRNLAQIREKLPQIPIIALTATATRRVRDDIIRILGLRSPRTFIASFNRPNLSYRIIPRTEPVKQIIEILDEHRGQSGIIYCMTRARTEELAEAINKQGFKALAYHAGIESKKREKLQDKFVRDEVPIMVATIAFGMGVDKPDVRFVVHHDLPKNIESYYQETGRAGRDGLPSECILLFNPADAGKIHGFIDGISDSQEQEVAREHLYKLVQFCESSQCRRVELLAYFGERFAITEDVALRGCGTCDNCLTPREQVDATLMAQKILSCVLRIQAKSGFSVGMQHVVDVLCGSSNEKILRWGHETLSTYGIGKDHPRQEWQHFCRELIRIGYLEQMHERFNFLEVTARGKEALKTKTVIELRKPLFTTRLTKEKRQQQRAMTGELQFDADLFEKLKEWRKSVAKAKGLPAYIVFHDATLQKIAAAHPTSLELLGQISGVGEKKLQHYGEDILAVLSS